MSETLDPRQGNKKAGRSVNYFAPDKGSEAGRPVVNFAVSLKDTQAKVQAQSAVSSHG
jgi:hypothetical protein